MKARRKSDGEIISVEAIIYNAKSGERYSPSELDFNVDADGTVIQGWAVRDKCGSLWVYDICPSDREYNYWAVPIEANGIVLPQTALPDITWESDPLQVEITIKRKKK